MRLPFSTVLSFRRNIFFRWKDCEDTPFTSVRLITYFLTLAFNSTDLQKFFVLILHVIFWNFALSDHVLLWFLFIFIQDLVGVIYAVGGQTKSGNSLSTVEVYDPIVGRDGNFWVVVNIKRRVKEPRPSFWLAVWKHKEPIRIQVSDLWPNSWHWRQLKSFRSRWRDAEAMSMLR